ncbi:hypothetical protein quinque_009956 [Culex quinquefasciatus]
MKNAVGTLSSILPTANPTSTPAVATAPPPPPLNAKPAPLSVKQKRQAGDAFKMPTPPPTQEKMLPPETAFNEAGPSKRFGHAALRFRPSLGPDGRTKRRAHGGSGEAKEEGAVSGGLPEGAHLRLEKYQTGYTRKKSALKALQEHHDEMKNAVGTLSSILQTANLTSTSAVATAPPPPPLNTKPAPLSVKQKRQAGDAVFDFALRWGRMAEQNAALTAEVARLKKREQFLEDHLKELRLRLEKYQTGYTRKESALKALQEHHDEMKNAVGTLSSILPTANPTSTPAVATAPPPPPLNTKPAPLSVKQKRQAGDASGEAKEEGAVSGGLPEGATPLRLEKYQTGYTPKESALKALQEHHDEMKNAVGTLPSILPTANPTSTPAVATAPPPPPLNTKPAPLSVKQKRQAGDAFKMPTPPPTQEKMLPPETAGDGFQRGRPAVATAPPPPPLNTKPAPLSVKQKRQAGDAFKMPTPPPTQENMLPPPPETAFNEAGPSKRSKQG